MSAPSESPLLPTALRAPEAPATATTPSRGGTGPTTAAAHARPGRQYALDVLRVLAICGVVAIHTIGLVVSNPELKGTVQWWVATAIDLGASWTVPLFVMISGVLVLHPRVHAAGPAAFYRKRFVRILPALVVWNLVYLIVARVLMRGEDLTRNGVIRLLIDGKIFTGMYFLWLIAGLYLVAPVIVAFLTQGGDRRARILAAVALSFTLVSFAVTGVAALIGVPRPIYLGALTHWWPYVGYFLAGWALRSVRLSRRGVLVASTLAVVLLAEGVWQWGVRPEYPVLQALMPISYLGTSIAVATICVFLVGLSLGERLRPGPRASRMLVRLSEASFGVFLVHLLILEALRTFVPAVYAADSLPVILGAYVVVLVSSFAVSVGASKIPYVRAIF